MPFTTVWISSGRGSGGPTHAPLHRASRRAARRRLPNCGPSTPSPRSPRSCAPSSTAAPASACVRAWRRGSSTAASSSSSSTTRLRKPACAGLVGSELPARHHELLRQRRPHLAHQPRDAAPRQRNAELDLRDREPGRARGDSQVAHGGEHECAADAPPVQLGDRDGAHLVHRTRHPPAAVGVVARWTACSAIAERRHVGARGKRRGPRPETTTTFRSSWPSNHRAADSISCNVCDDSGFSFVRAGEREIAARRRRR